MQCSAVQCSTGPSGAAVHHCHITNHHCHNQCPRVRLLAFLDVAYAAPLPELSFWQVLARGFRGVRGLERVLRSSWVRLS